MQLVSTWFEKTRPDVSHICIQFETTHELKHQSSFSENLHFNDEHKESLTKYKTESITTTKFICPNDTLNLIAKDC